MPNNDYAHRELTDKIIGAAYRVYNTLGAGFLEKVYENAMAIELRHLGLKVEQQYPIKVFYKSLKIGDYFADLLIEDKVIAELKATSENSPAYEIQLVNYLKATGIEVGLLINFGDKINIKRKVMTKKKDRISENP